MVAEAARPIYTAGGCEIDLARRELRVVGSPAPLGARAFEILEALAETAGTLVTKSELMDRIWPGAIVSENTLQVHVSALRKAFGSRRAMLRTESGRGYRLLGNWTIQDQAPATAPTAPRQSRPPEERQATNIPHPITALVGRAAALERSRDLLSAYRMLTLTGAGGIGKSTLALHAARAVLSEFEHGGWLVELASLSDPNLVPSAAAGALSLRLGSGQISASAVARAVSDRNLLLVLDNCEHVIDAAASLAETLLRWCPRITILATSREVLQVSGECVYRVPPLEVPAAEEDGPDHILGHSAVELFVTRAREAGAEAAPQLDGLASVAAICRHLDGMPLAIEFAAARAAVLGIGQVAADLEDRFALLTSRRRTALPRHQTLRATLDWSYRLLPKAEQQLLCRLALFFGGFTLDAAGAVVADLKGDWPALIDGIANLVNKSLITAESSDYARRWRLLETTRVYALEKLAESGEAEQTARLHARFYLTFFAPFATEAQRQAAIDDIGRYRREIDNLRAALNWAFSADGDHALGVELAAAAADFWAAASLVGEACDWAGKALARIGAGADTRSEMVLRCSLGVGLIYTQGMIAAAHAALTRALALSRQFADFDYEQRATHDLWLFSARGGVSNDALALARRYEDDAARSRDPQAQSVADWITGIPQIYLGAHIEATDRLQRAIDTYPVARRRRDLVRFGADLRASAFGHLGATLLSRGLLDAASRAATSAIEEARGTGHPTVLCIALAWAVGMVFLSLGQLDEAELYGDELVDHAYKHAMRPFHAAGQCVRGSLAAKRGHPEAGIGSFRSGLTEMREASYLLFYPYFLTDFAAVLGAIGRVDEGLVEIEEALRVAVEIDYRWFVPEIRRTKAELLARRGSDDPASIADLFRQSMSEAHRQQALYWELSAALSLAELMRNQGRDADARAALAPVYGRFTQGFEASKMKQAKALLNELA